jgi:hypothetical protein
MDGLFTVLILLALLSPVVAIAFAIRCYKLHRNAPPPKRSISVATFIAVLLVSALISYWLGVGVGINVACSSASSSNLCGLWGFFVLGPLLSSFTVSLLAQFWSSNAHRAL